MRRSGQIFNLHKSHRSMNLKTAQYVHVPYTVLTIDPWTEVLSLNRAFRFSDRWKRDVEMRDSMKSIRCPLNFKPLNEMRRQRMDSMWRDRWMLSPIPKTFPCAFEHVITLTVEIATRICKLILWYEHNQQQT